uniref:Uncharacterized protein n=1 Tax=Trichuris muris TaxID=70415 RepID=A0A5S6Q647_TRIMR
MKIIMTRHRLALSRRKENVDRKIPLKSRLTATRMTPSKVTSGGHRSSTNSVVNDCCSETSQTKVQNGSTVCSQFD